MFSTVLAKATGLLDNRLLLGALFPTLVFGLGIVVVVSEGEGVALADIGDLWTGRSAAEQVLVSIAAVSVLVVASYVLMASLTSITRLFEGYFGPAAWFDVLTGGRLKARQFERRSATSLVDTSQAMPTSLGTALREAERHPTRAYGMDSVLLWPRLTTILPEGMLKAIDAARAPMDFLVVATFYATAFFVFAAIYIPIADAGRTLYLISLSAACIIAFVSYRGAVSAAVDFGSQVRAAFDLYRFDLLEELHLPLPMSRAEEKRLWTEVNEVARVSEPLDAWIYEHPKSDA